MFHCTRPGRSGLQTGWQPAPESGFLAAGGQSPPGLRWVSGNWALKGGPACMECPLGPGRAPAPGELARAERLHSSTGRPDSSATLQTSLRSRLEAKTARRCRAPPVPDSQTCRFHDPPWPSGHQQNCWPLRDLGSARPRARAGFGFGVAGLALD